jgi:putative CocE/NonD family hydrolase
MPHFRRVSLLALSLGFLIAPAVGQGSQNPAAVTKNDIPAKFTPTTDTFDYDKREVMIPMRDGVKLKTFILVPKGAKNAPILMDRTPYNAEARVERTHSPHLADSVSQMLDTAVAAGYIIVFQDVRGKYGSEGDYVMTRPLRGPLNKTNVDHATDTYDTIEWLVKNVPESNGRVGTIGGSYEGFTTVMSVVDPHPALKVAVPFAPMVDGWMGDDWFHNGAFRQDASLDYVYGQEGARKGEHWWSGTRDTYDEYLRAGSAGAMAQSRGLEQLGFWRDLAAHPAYDEFWQDQALDKIIPKRKLTVPMMIVSGLFDQEDIYGGPALFKGIMASDPQAPVHLVMGPWNHGGGRSSGKEIGAIEFPGETATWFRKNYMQPFLDHFLKDAPDPQTPRVLAYETGANEWRKYDAWPRACATNCAQKSRSLYLLSGGKLGFDKASAGGSQYDEYVSDPAKPVPYRASRPTLNGGDKDSTWGEWLADDQRNAAARPDVLVYESEVLKTPVRVAGQPIARLFASTSGTDSDWVVKIIDVYPDQDANHPKMAGYQQMISADIFRGRYREDFAKPTAIKANAVLPYAIHLPHINHTFLPGHRMMVQVQSTWFPLYDRNPQTYVPNIMFAKPADFQKATQRIWHTPEQSSAIELPVIE